MPLSDGKTLAEIQALNQMRPSGDFTATVDTTRVTKGLYVVNSTNVAMTIHNEIADADVTVRVGGMFYPFETSTAVTVTGYDVIYCY